MAVMQLQEHWLFVKKKHGVWEGQDQLTGTDGHFLYRG